MKKRTRVKVNYGNLFILILVISALVGGTYYLYNRLNNDDTDDNKGKIPFVSNKDKRLKELGYSNKEIDLIYDNMKSEDIEKIDKKYDNISDFVGLKYFHIENMERYENYKKNSDFDYKEVIWRVNAHLDNEGYTNVIEVTNPDDPFVIVNKHYAVPEDYEPEGLINVGNGQRMKEEAGHALMNMIDDINASGLYLQAQSGYRSIATQTGLYNGYVKSYGLEEADLVSAKPRHSEHHTGLAIDVSNDGTLEKTFENTPEFEWLKENAHKYGFILRYPNDKTDITGYDYEPWHYRYVGVDTATLINNEGITYEEYAVKYLGLY